MPSAHAWLLLAVLAWRYRRCAFGQLLAWRLLTGRVWEFDRAVRGTGE